MAATAKLRAMLTQDDKIIVCPGVYDGLTARIALSEGFDCLYMTGAGTALSKLGVADLGLATLNDMRENAGMIASLNRNIPLIADADTGFGGPLMVGRTTEQHIQAGVAALHLEDQVITKRCGHLLNKEIVDENTFLSRIRAAVNARTQAHGDIIIIARSDALQSLGYDMAVSRLKAAVAVGADVAFLEGFSTIEEGRRVCKELAPTPVLLNMVPGGVTPQISVREAEKLGFKLIIYPGFALTPVYSTVLAAAKELRSTGDYKVLEGGNPKEIFNLCGLREAMAFDLGAGGNLYSKGV